MSRKQVKVKLTVSKAIDPHSYEAACARAHEAAVRSLHRYGQLTDAEAAQEMDLSLEECEAWLAGEDIPESRRLQRKWAALNVEVETRDLSYYDFLTRGSNPENDLASADPPSLPDAA
jgi:hypothetical protein